MKLGVDNQLVIQSSEQKICAQKAGLFKPPLQKNTYYACGLKLLCSNGIFSSLFPPPRSVTLAKCLVSGSVHTTRFFYRIKMKNTCKTINENNT